MYLHFVNSISECCNVIIRISSYTFLENSYSKKNENLPVVIMLSFTHLYNDDLNLNHILFNCSFLNELKFILILFNHRSSAATKTSARYRSQTRQEVTSFPPCRGWISAKDTPSFWCTRWRHHNPLRSLAPFSRSSKRWKGEIWRRHRSCWSVINATNLNPTDRSLLPRARNRPKSGAAASWKPLPKRMKTSKNCFRNCSTWRNGGMLAWVPMPPARKDRSCAKRSSKGSAPSCELREGMKVEYQTSRAGLRCLDSLSDIGNLV